MPDAPRFALLLLIILLMHMLVIVLDTEAIEVNRPYLWDACGMQACRASRDLRPPGYLTVTSVPTGISAKSRRATSPGSRMQPCEAG